MVDRWPGLVVLTCKRNKSPVVASVTEQTWIIIRTRTSVCVVISMGEKKTKVGSTVMRGERGWAVCGRGKADARQRKGGYDHSLTSATRVPHNSKNGA